MKNLESFIPKGDSCVAANGTVCPLYQSLLIKDEDSERGVKSPIEIPFCAFTLRGDASLLLESEVSRVKEVFSVEDVLELDFLSSQGLSSYIKECEKDDM